MKNEIKPKVIYEDFGAVGDGVTDDFFAIKKAHDYANENGLPVCGTAGKTYYIHDIVGDGECASPAIIKTDVDWTDVKFIIDDRGYYYKDKNNSCIFKIASDYGMITVTDREIIEKVFPGGRVKAGYIPRIDWSDFGYAALLVIYNANHKDYVRYGGNADSGGPRRELIVVDAEGNVREETPLMRDYDEITELRIYRADDTPITVKGGHFTHIVNDTPMVKEDWGYFGRGIPVNRSNTTIDGLTHIVTGELPGINETGNTDPKGPPYGGFIGVSFTNDVRILNCTLTARRPSGIAGTYDFQGNMSNNLYLYNVNQSNYYGEDGVTPTLDYKHTWGIGGTNFCKNLTYDSCMLSRFDAHCGLYNGKVINSHVCNFELIGAGNMLIENTVLTPTVLPPIMLRSDYGCTWNGEITVKNCTVKKYANPIKSLFTFGWVNHNFGYVCYVPSITVDNLKWEIDTDEVMLTSYKIAEDVSAEILSDGTKNNNVYKSPEYMRVINNETKMRYTVYDTPLLRGAKTEGVCFKPLENQ